MSNALALASFKSRIGFWLKKSSPETTPGELVELANLLVELDKVISSHSVVSVISELPQLTKFLYRIVSEPSFRIILVSNRVSLCFCRCIYIFVRSRPQEASDEAVSEQRRQEIRTKSRDWGLMVLRLALSPRWMDNTAQSMLPIAPIVSNSCSSSLVQKQLRKNCIDLIDYHASHISRKHSSSNPCTVLCCPYNLETHWKRMKEIGLLILSILHYSSGLNGSDDEEEHWCLPIIRHWLLVSVYQSAWKEGTSILQLQTKGLCWEPKKGYLTRIISLSIPHLWSSNLPAIVTYRLLFENANLRKEYCDWLETLVLKHLYLCDMFLLETDVFSNDQRSLLLQVLQEPILVCWMRVIWFEKIEQCLDRWNKRILISFWNEIIQHSHPSARCSLVDFASLQNNNNVHSNFGMNELIDMHVENILFTRTEASFVRKYFWESVYPLERHFVISCLKATAGYLCEEEFRSSMTLLSKWWCIPLLSSSFQCWNTASYQLFQYICYRYDCWKKKGFSPQSFTNNEEPTLSNIQMQLLFVDILFNVLSSFPLHDDNGTILVYMEIIETILEYCNNHHHSTLLPYLDTKYRTSLLKLYQQIGQDSCSLQRRRRYQLFCQYKLGNST